MSEQTETNEKKVYDSSPKLETIQTLSADGKYWIHKTIITDIKPRTYLDKVLAPKISEERIN